MATTSESSQPPADGRFLRRWFRVLTDRVFLCDRRALDQHIVRVQTSGTSDWWIQILPWKRCPCCDRSANQEAANTTTKEEHLRELRETLVLLTMNARVDYDSWLQELSDTSGLRFHHQGILDTRFSFVVGDDRTDHGIHPCDLLADTLGTANHQYSDEFKASYEQLTARAQTLGVPLSSLRAPIAVRFEFSQLVRSQQRNIETLTSVGSSVARMLQSKREEHSALPFFELDSVELRLRGHELNGRTLAAIGRIVSTGVKIRHLELPGRVKEPIDQGDRPLWVRSLARRLFRSSDRDASPDFPQIERLEMPPVYFATDLAVSWLPFLTTARSVRSLTINTDVANIGRAQSSASALAWGYLAYAMFSKDSTNFVESLHLSGLHSVEMDTIASFGDVAASPTPRIDLEQLLESHPRGHDQSFMWRNAFCVTWSQPSSPSSNKLRRLVLSVSKKETASNDPSSVVPLITQVLRGAGTRLTDLAMDGAQIDDNALRTCLELCPSLESLRLNGASLQSFDSLRLPNLTSLDLRSIRTSQEPTHAFLECLKAGDSVNARALERLRIGRGWNDHINTLDPKILDDMLIANQTLAYLHVFRPNDPFSTAPSTLWTRLKNYNGKLISSRDRPLALDCKISFLATTQHLAEKTQLTPLNRDVITQIFHFAATPRQRTVVIETDLGPCV